MYKGFVTVITAPTSDPVTVSDIKDHLRIDISDDDDLITALISAAVSYVSTFTRRSLLEQTLKFVLPEFPAGSDTITLPYPPLSTITIDSVKYRDADDGTLKTWSDTEYEVIQTGATSYGLRYVLNGSWPTDVLSAVDAVQITYTAGESLAADIDQRIILAIKLLVGNWYENREDTTTLTLRNIPMGVEMLLWQVRSTTEFFQ